MAMGFVFSFIWIAGGAMQHGCNEQETGKPIVKVVYIASLGHSGSTLLDMMLSAHPEITGLGETHMILDRDRRKQRLETLSRFHCTCGAVICDCPVWGRLMESLGESGGDNATFARYYQELLERVNALEGTAYVSDSSKYLKPLRRVAQACEENGMARGDLKVLHLVRDVRGFARSYRRLESLNALQTAKQMWTWKLYNQRIEKTIEELGLPALRMGYEELCLSAEATLRRVCDFLELDYHTGMASPAHASGHVATGNVMRVDKKKRSGLFYDHRWFLDDCIGLWYLTLPGIRRRNRRWVYGSLSGEDSKTIGYAPA